MLNSEPQTNVITSETLQIFYLLSDLSKIPDVRRLLLLKRTSIEKKVFEKAQKRVAIFSGNHLQRTTCNHHSPSP